MGQVKVVIARQRHGKHVSAATDTDTAIEDMVFCAVIAVQWHGKHVSAATNQHATIEEVLKMVFSLQSVPRLYNEDQQLASSWLAMRSLHC
jgi:phosphosulfolactate phosphohydrolase-like enzyme